MFCTRCGHQNPDDARFCANCGAPLSRPGDPVGGASERGDDAGTTSTLSLSALESRLESESAGGEQVAASAAQSLPPEAGLLVVKRGPNAGSRFLLDGDVTTTGRHPDSDIFLDDVTVSRRHAEFHREGGSFSVRDVGSLNGTYLNRERIDAATLTSSDEVQIGKFRLVFLTGAGAEGSAAPAGG